MLNTLRTHHKEIVRLSFQGMKPADIALKLEAKLQTVYKILRDPLAQGYLEGLQDKADDIVLDVRSKLAEMNKPALEGLLEIVEGGEGISRPVQLSAIKDVLDRNGHKPVERHEHAHGHFTTDDLKDLKERANNARPTGVIDI